MRETFHVHMLSIEAALYVNSVSRNAKCSMPGTNVSISIIDLRKIDVQCENVASAVSKLIPCPWTTIIMFIGLSVKFVNFAQLF